MLLGNAWEQTHSKDEGFMEEWVHTTLVFLLLFAADKLVVAILVDLLKPHQFRSQPSFDLPPSVPTCPYSTSVLLFGSLPPLLPPVCFLFAFKLSQGLSCHLQFVLHNFLLIFLKSYTQWHNSPSLQQS